MKTYGLYLEPGFYTAACVETKRGGHSVHTLTQSFSLSHSTSKLWDKKSSEKKEKKYTVALVFAHAQRIELELPPGLPAYEVTSTVSWLLEQQGYTPLQQWLWDYQCCGDQSRVEVLICEKEGYDQILGGLHSHPENLRVRLICDAASLVCYSSRAHALIANYSRENLPENTDSAVVAVAAALGCSEQRYV